MNLTDFIGREWNDLTVIEQIRAMQLIWGWSKIPHEDFPDQLIWVSPNDPTWKYYVGEPDPRTNYGEALQLFEAKARPYRLEIRYSPIEDCIAVIWHVSDNGRRICCTPHKTLMDAISEAVYEAWQTEQTESLNPARIPEVSHA